MRLLSPLVVAARDIGQVYKGTGMGGRNYTCSMTVLYLLDILWCPLLEGERRGYETTLTTSCCCKGYRAGVQGDGDGGQELYL